MKRGNEYAKFVTHPRYGQRPRITGLNPEADYAGKIFLHWHSADECRIPNTAIPADLSRQSPATVPVTHYFDVKRKCRDCGRLFIFFAEEQKYWYEELGFPLESDCVRCVDCRKKQQGIELKRNRYEELFHVSSRTVEQNLEMADCCLSLVEASIFHKRQIQQVRRILNELSQELDEITRERFNDLWSRIRTLETEIHRQQQPPNE